MGKIITIANHKGGVGKTTLVLNLSSYLTDYYKSILVLDFDPQANTTWGLFNAPDHQRVKIHDLLKFGVTKNIKDAEELEKFDKLVSAARVDMSKNGSQVSLIGSSLDLATAKIELSKYESIVYFKVIEVIRHLSNDYDITLVDTPPSLEMLTASAIYSSDYIILPIQLDLMAIKGAQDVLRNILPTAKQYFNPGIKPLGVLANLHKATRSQRVSAGVAREAFGDLMFKTIISQSEKIKSLAVLRGTVDNFSPKSKSSDQFRAFAKEVYERIERDRHGKER